MLLPLFLTLSTIALAHSVLTCVQWGNMTEEDPYPCPQAGAQAYHPAYVKAGQIQYQHTKPGQLCNGNKYIGGNLTGGEGTAMTKLKAGETTVLAWPSNNHGFINNDGSADWDKYHKAGTAQFAYVWHSPTEDPDDTLFHTTPYAQYDWNNCDRRPNPDANAPICRGNLTLSPRLETGVHTFVWGWHWFVGAQATVVDYITCFQIEITNDAPASPAISTSSTYGPTDWEMVRVASTFSPMQNLVMTAEPSPATKTNSVGSAYPVYWHDPSKALGATKADVAAKISPTAYANAAAKISPTAYANAAAKISSTRLFGLSSTLEIAASPTAASEATSFSSGSGVTLPSSAASAAAVSGHDPSEALVATSDADVAAKIPLTHLFGLSSALEIPESPTATSEASDDFSSDLGVILPSSATSATAVGASTCGMLFVAVVLLCL